MSQDKAMVRELVERIEGVTRTWFELEIEGHNRKKTLVVEVSFDLDANSAHFLRATCDAIEETVATVLREENSDMVSKLKIVNRAQQSADKSADAATSRPGNRTTREMRAVGMVMARDGDVEAGEVGEHAVVGHQGRRRPQPPVISPDVADAQIPPASAWDQDGGEAHLRRGQQPIFKRRRPEKPGRPR